jgi:hypothetical protein
MKSNQTVVLQLLVALTTVLISLGALGATPHQIVLATDPNGSGNCVQYADGGANPVSWVTINKDDTVTWSYSGGSFSLTFTPGNIFAAGTPFEDANGNWQYTFTSGHPTSQPATPPLFRKYFYYYQVTLNNTDCKAGSVGNDIGVIVQH